MDYPCGYTKAKVKADRKNAVPSSPWKYLTGLRAPLKGCSVFTQTAGVSRAGAVTGVSGNVLTGSGLACPYHSSRMQQNPWSGDPGRRKVTVLPFFNSLVPTVVQMEELLIPGLRSLSWQVGPVQGFAHREKSCK